MDCESASRRSVGTVYQVIGPAITHFPPMIKGMASCRDDLVISQALDAVSVLGLQYPSSYVD